MGYFPPVVGMPSQVGVMMAAPIRPATRGSPKIRRQFSVLIRKDTNN
jgi:hypothetical protein